MSTERLLREYVRELLKEDAETSSVYHGLAAADAANNPYGASFGDEDDLYKVFVKPFTDVVNTALGKTKEISQRTQTLVRVALEGLATTLFPFFKDSYDEIFAKERKILDNIKQEYGEVYQANWDAFRDNDVFWTAFCYAPHWVLGAKFAKHSPKITADLLSVLTGGSLDKYLDRIKQKFSWEEPKTGLDYKGHSPRGYGMHSGYGPNYTESVIREDEEGKSDKASKVAELLSSDKVLAKVDESPLVKKMQAQTRGAVDNALRSVVQQAQAVAGSKSLEDLQRKTGKKLPGLDKLRQAPEQERQKAEQQMLAGLKKSLKAFYVKNLSTTLKQAIDAGVPEGSPFVQAYQQAIGKIKSM